jgi:murein DD-endopeptidase MepM/ murein hydrolase activator NlpD
MPAVMPPLSTAQPAPSGQPNLIIPVAGVRASDLRDTFTDARSKGRVHNAIDIMAPRGRPVLAVSHGEIVRLFLSDLGGISIYQFSPDKKIVFYYAHLERYAEGLIAGHQARQGEVIAYVGDTGNAGPGNYHLHFAMWHVTNRQRYWDGENINPYPILSQTP